MATAVAVVAAARLLPAQRAPEPVLAVACPACGATLTARVDPLPAHAEMGTWFDHPPLPGLPAHAGMTGHTVTYLAPSPLLTDWLTGHARAQAGHVQPALY